MAELHHSIPVTCHPFPRGRAGGGGGEGMGRWSGPSNTEEVALGLGGCRRKGCPRHSGELLQGGVGRTPGPCVHKGLRLRRGAEPEARPAQAQWLRGLRQGQQTQADEQTSLPAAESEPRRKHRPPTVCLAPSPSHHSRPSASLPQGERGPAGGGCGVGRGSPGCRELRKAGSPLAHP